MDAMSWRAKAARREARARREFEKGWQDVSPEGRWLYSLLVAVVMLLLEGKYLLAGAFAVAAAFLACRVPRRRTPLEPKRDADARSLQWEE